MDENILFSALKVAIAEASTINGYNFDEEDCQKIASDLWNRFDYIGHVVSYSTLYYETELSEYKRLKRKFEGTSDEIEDRKKHHKEVFTGTVKWFNAEKGYGFIDLDDNSDCVFAHFADIITDGFRNLEEGERVKFEIEEGKRGKNARKIVKLTE